MGVKAFVLVTVSVRDVREALEHIRGVEGVSEAHVIAGIYDIIARVEADDADGLFRIVADGIARAPGVQKTMTLVVLA